MCDSCYLLGVLIITFVFFVVSFTLIVKHRLSGCTDKCRVNTGSFQTFTKFMSSNKL